MLTVRINTEHRSFIKPFAALIRESATRLSGPFMVKSTLSRISNEGRFLFVIVIKLASSFKLTMVISGAITKEIISRYFRKE